MIGDVRGPITYECDKYIKNKFHNEIYEDLFKTYIYRGLYNDILHWSLDEKQKGYKYLSISVPGATRGHIKIDRHYTILDIQFYEVVCFHEGIGCYTEDIKEVPKKFIGTHFNIDDYQLVKVE